MRKWVPSWGPLIAVGVCIFCFVSAVVEAKLFLDSLGTNPSLAPLESWEGAKRYYVGPATNV